MVRRPATSRRVNGAAVFMVGNRPKRHAHRAAPPSEIEPQACTATVVLLSVLTEEVPTVPPGRPADASAKNRRRPSGRAVPAANGYNGSRPMRDNSWRSSAGRGVPAATGGARRPISSIAR